MTSEIGRVTFKAAGEKRFPSDLAAFEGTAGSPGVALTPSSVGTPAHADTERVAGHRTGEWFKAEGVPLLERKADTGHRVVPLATHTAQRRSELQAMYARFRSGNRTTDQRVLGKQGNDQRRGC